MSLREAAEKALDVLESLQGGCTDSDDGTVEAITVWCPEIIEALRDALAEAEKAEAAKAKPLAWRIYDYKSALGGGLWMTDSERDAVEAEQAGCVVTALVAQQAEPADPPAALPDDEVLFVFDAAMQGRHWWSGGTWLYPGDAVVVRRAAARGKG